MILPMAVSAPHERSLGTVRRAMGPVCRSGRQRAMLERPKFLLACGVALECMTPTPKNFAGSPTRANQNGCVLRSVERREAEGRALLQRGILGAVGAHNAGFEGAGLTLAPGATHLVVYHLVVDGVARAALPDGRSLTLEPGDIVVFPHGNPHELTARPGHGTWTKPR